MKVSCSRPGIDGDLVLQFCHLLGDWKKDRRRSFVSAQTESLESCNVSMKLDLLNRGVCEVVNLCNTWCNI